MLKLYMLRQSQSLESPLMNLSRRRSRPWKKIWMRTKCLLRVHLLSKHGGHGDREHKLEVLREQMQRRVDGVQITVRRYRCRRAQSKLRTKT